MDKCDCCDENPGEYRITASKNGLVLDDAKFCPECLPMVVFKYYPKRAPLARLSMEY